jgi:DNA-binding NtrC family response regulator
MPPPRILIVDDNDGIRLGVRLYLQGCGFEVLEASDCATAVRALRGDALDLAILDYSLPDGTALELIHEARAAQPQAKVVVLTAYPSVKLAEEVQERGAARFLIKPIELSDLRKVLDELLGDREGQN